MHVVALVIYAAGMAAYSVFAIVDWVNAERPVLFSSEETRHFESMPLNLSIDCVDCRRFLTRAQDSAKWKLSWDYSGLPNGCAARSPALFDSRLRDFCAAQNNASLYKTTPRRYDTAAFGTCNGWSIILPWSLQPLIPFGVAPTMDVCMAKCDATPGCKGINYALAGFSSPNPSTGQQQYFPKGVCAMLTTNKCPEWQDPDSTVSSPVVTSMVVTGECALPLDLTASAAHHDALPTTDAAPHDALLTTPPFSPHRPSHHTALLTTPPFSPHRPSHHTALLTTPPFSPHRPSHHTALLTTPPFSPHRPSHHTALLTTPPFSPHRPSSHCP